MLLQDCLKFKKLVACHGFTTLRFVKKIGLMHCVLCFMKVEGNNLGSMATTLRSTIECKSLKILQVYEGIYFKHVMSKACSYATNNNKVFMGLNLVSVKDSQAAL